ncbi:ATP-binding cassette sub-family A member 3 like protein [Argiope bruennichi]|uniref:ATP-binding cassette sub-family A member 3 like protein n=1 Tax=Argiope bruennichi TaxID=94029 RepID=A0A8T0EA06_ARGBR|nr:ATP-binding cassette sub-family A member 3 like protein [Argiope bruennichi]
MLNMGWNTFKSQWKALVKRNLLLKKRNSYQLITALIIPVAATLYILHQSNQPYITSSAKIGVEYDLPLIYLDEDLIGIPNNFHLCVAPSDIEEHFLSSIQASLSLYGQKRFVQISSLEDEKHLNDRLLKRYQYNATECDAGVTIIGNISTSGSYIVRVPDDGCSPVLAQYCSYGILSNIQQAVDNAFLQEWTGNPNFKLPSAKVRGLIDVHETPRNTMYRVVKFLLLVIYFPIITIITENIIHEKNSKIKESMFLMGMKPFPYWSAWLFCEIVVIIIVMCPVSIALCVASVSPIRDILLHFLLWFGLGCSLMVFTMTITRFCTQPMVANTVAFSFLLSAVASEAFQQRESHEDMSIIEYFAMLASPVAYEKGFNRIIREHDYGGAVPAILIIFADLILYSIVDVILENLSPCGVTIPWGKLKPNGKNSKGGKTEDVHENEAFIGSSSSLPNLDPCIKLEKIRKAFSSGFKQPRTIALDGVTFSIYKGEVTCLLGPNGAGKSTLMKIVSRILSPDEGKMTIATSLQLGVCPQENILHDELNAYEHLQFFGSLKGIPNVELDSKVTTLLENFDLLSKKGTWSKVLSGGQKRKLCVAIAMIGEPEVLLLDEPSSGMSPYGRRQLWNMLQEYTKLGRSVLFTTHYMDEAELLSDRIALLNYGKLKYYGTTMDIKKQFGGGYHVRISLQSEPSLYCKSELLSLISDLPSKPKVMFTSDSEIFVKLHSFDAAYCVEFFSKIEEQYKDIGSDCFTICVSALEEIFSYLSEENKEQVSEERKIEDPKFEYVSSTWTNINELIRARCRVLLRSYYTLFPIILPILLLSWNKLLSNATRRNTEISPSLYKHEIIQVINATGIPLTDFEKALSKLDMHFTLVNSALFDREKNFIKTEVNNYGFFNEMLDVNWNWTVSLSNPFALPALQNLMSNILWKTFDDELGRELKISVQPITIIEQNFSFFQSETFLTLMHISLCLIFVALALGLEVVKEKEKNVIWLISTTRNNALSYWISTFCTHLALCSVSFFVIQSMLLIFGVYVFQKFSLWIAFYLCMPGCLLTVYLMGQFYKNYKSADIGMTFTVVIATTALFLAFLAAVAKEVPHIPILNILALFLIPVYAPFGLIILLCQGETDDSVTSGYQWKIVCGLIIPFSNLIYGLLLIYLGEWITFRRKAKIQLMSQATWDNERNPKATVVLKSIKKAYVSKRCSRKKRENVAIKDLSMTFLEGEIFALMGSNGAGKSTLMKLLSLNVGLTCGEIIIRDKLLDSTTYCAEENTIWPNLTVEEHLRLFAVLNGVPRYNAEDVVNNIMKDLALGSHATKRARHLSGGYQRKLSIALSLLGNSKLVLLDEPTTGMDPVSKQRLWSKLHKDFPSTSDRTLIVTTHSSNEAEINCTRIGLFIDGNLRCLGTSQALKKQFSIGYELTVRLRNGEIEKFNRFLISEIREAFEKSQRGLTLQYYIPAKAFKSMSALFTEVVKIQSFDDVEDCFITECSLDQIILDLLSQANAQIGDEECSV